MKINKDFMVTNAHKHGGKRKKPVTVLIPHHNAGVTTGYNLAKYIYETNRQLSATYIIGQEGEVYQGLDESLEPYTTSNREIDTRGITFEIANSKGAPNWEISDKAFDSLVELSIDICKRHNIKEVKYTGDKKGNIHLHKWYANTNCPGPYLESKMPEYAKRINEALKPKPQPTPTEPKGTYKEVARFRNTVGTNIIYRNHPEAKGVIAGRIAHGEVYDYNKVFIGNGYVWISNGKTWVPTGEAKNGKRVGKTWGSFYARPTGLKVGDRVKVKKGAKSYTGQGIASFVFNNTYRIDSLKVDRAVLDSKGINTPFNIKDLVKV